MTFQELATKSATELRTLLNEQRDQLRTLRFKVAADQHKNVREIRAVRTTIAQILTLLNGAKPKAQQDSPTTTTHGKA